MQAAAASCRNEEPMTRRSRSRNRSAARKPGLIVVVLVVLLAGWLWQQHRTQKPAAAPETTASTSSDSGRQSRPLPLPDLERQSATGMRDDALPAFLPTEARETLHLIARGGPFPHPQDGGVFGNREGRLPDKPRGYYHEYTVDTPGLNHRGTRRIITGGQPPVVYYYTDDHYDTFRSFQVAQ
jgi:guanyl-specific ribonuclease Sa